MIWNTLFVESGRRPVDSVDTSRPVEDSRQNGFCWENKHYTEGYSGATTL